ncbi:MAG: hypothetical protein AB7V14_09060 [Kiritimatiellia bacterium]
MKIRILSKNGRKIAKIGIFRPFLACFSGLGTQNSLREPNTRDLAGKQEGWRLDPVFRLISCFLLKFGSSGKFRPQDPVPVHFSRQGREGRQEAFAMPKASWRTMPQAWQAWRSLREEFFGSDIRSGRVNIQRIFADFLVPGRYIGLFFLFS